MQDFFNDNFKDKILIDEPMSNHTSFKVGGKVDILFLPNNILDITKVVDFCEKNKVNYFVMGNGTNLLVSDHGFNGVVIKINKNFLGGDIKLDKYNNTIESSSGVLLSQLSSFALRNNLTGLEFASGIPGTLGGAICINSGAYGSEIKDIFVSAKILHKNQVKTYDDLNFSYRSSIINKEHIVLSAKLKLSSGNFEDISNRIKEYSKKRRDTQPLNLPSAGSTFKRPKGNFAGKLIMEAGLSNYKIGGACISPKHCGFIINLGNATAQNIMDLIYYTQKVVKDKFNILLEPEIKFLGEFDKPI